jgi:hypothetical protein
MVMRMDTQRAAMMNNASRGFLNRTNTGDHARLSASWTQNIVGTDGDRAAARPMRRYNTVHTGAKIQSGGRYPGTCGASLKFPDTAPERVPRISGVKRSPQFIYCIHIFKTVSE